MCDKRCLMQRGLNYSFGGIDPMPAPFKERLSDEQTNEISRMLCSYRIELMKYAERDVGRKEEISLMADALLCISNSLSMYCPGVVDSLEHAHLFNSLYIEAVIKREKRESQV